MKTILTVGFCLCLIMAGYCFLLFVRLIMQYNIVDSQQYLFLTGIFTLLAGVAEALLGNIKKRGEKCWNY
jgi:hypothetical protein